MESNEIEEENKKSKECLFGFAKINKYFIFPFLCPIICMICNYFLNLIIIDNDEFEKKQFLLSSFMDITFIGGGLVYFISCIRVKTEQTRENSENKKERKESSSASSIKLIYNERYKINKLKVFGILIVISLFLSIFNVCDVYALDKNTFEERLYFLFFISIFSKIILKNNIYSHHILSLFISSIGLILLFIPIMQVITEDDIFINVCIFIFSIGYSLILVLIKYLMEKYYISPYLMLLFMGTFSLLFNILGFSVYSLIVNKDFSVITDNFYFENFQNKTKFSIYLVITFISASILQIFSNLVVFYFSPTLLMVTDSISPMLFWFILQLPNEKNTFIIIINILGYLISLFASLIYNEIIIFNFLGFNMHTKKYIEERQNKELISLKQTENEIQTGKLNQTENTNDLSDDEEN